MNLALQIIKICTQDSAATTGNNAVSKVTCGCGSVL